MRTSRKLMLCGLCAVCVSFLFVFPIFILPTPPHNHSSPAASVELTYGRWNDTNPVVAPNGETIVFESNRGALGNGRNLWMMSSAGTHLTCLVCSESDKQSPEFSPNGEELAFLQTDKNGSMDIWEINVQNHDLSRVTSDGSPKGEFVWNPNGTSIAFDELKNGIWKIEVANLDSFPNQISMTLPPAGVNNIDPSFTSNGSVILFSSNQSANGSLGYHIWSINLRSRNLVELTNGDANDTQPMMSPNGQYIAFFSDRTGMRSLWVMDSNGSGMAQAVSNPITISIPEAGPQSIPAWLPDSSGVLYYSSIFDNFSDVYAFYPNVNVTWTPGTPYVFYTVIGSSLTRITSGFSVNISPMYDASTKTVLCASNDGGSSFHIWKIPLGPEVPISPSNPYGQ